MPKRKMKRLWRINLHSINYFFPLSVIIRGMSDTVTHLLLLKLLFTVMSTQTREWQYDIIGGNIQITSHRAQSQFWCVLHWNWTVSPHHYSQETHFHPYLSWHFLPFFPIWANVKVLFRHTGNRDWIFLFSTCSLNQMHFLICNKKKRKEKKMETVLRQKEPDRKKNRSSCAEEDKPGWAADRQRDRCRHSSVPSEVYIEQQRRVWCEPQGPTRVESCNDTPCNTSDSHFQNISTIYHTPNHPVRERVCVCVVGPNDRLNITSIFICMWMCAGSVYDYILASERKKCVCAGPSGSVSVCAAI